MGFEKYQHHASYSDYYKAVDESEKWQKRVLLAKAKGNKTLAAQAEVMHLHYAGQVKKAELAIKAKFNIPN